MDSRLLTSDASTQETGPKLKEKQILSMKIMPIPALWAERLMMPESRGKEASMAESIEKRTTFAAQPKRRGFLRPTVSSMKMMKLWVRESAIVMVLERTAKRLCVHEIGDGTDGTVNSLNQEELASFKAQCSIPTNQILLASPHQKFRKIEVRTFSVHNN